MELWTKAQLKKLHANYAESADGKNHGHKPVVKWFCPWGSATWLISELYEGDGDHAFGLCDLGMGCPELGYVSVAELKALEGPLGLKIERDLHWKADKTLIEYADAAREAGRIVA